MSVSQSQAPAPGLVIVRKLPQGAGVVTALALLAQCHRSKVGSRQAVLSHSFNLMCVTVTLSQPPVITSLRKKNHYPQLL